MITLLAAVIAAVPPTIIALAVWTSTRRTRRALGAHIGDEGVTTEAIMSYLEKLAQAAGIVDGEVKGGK